MNDIDEKVVDFCPKDGATFEQALKINPREKLKASKVCPLDVIDDIEEMTKRGYLDVPEEDFVLLKWWGVIHEKPKIGKFSIRIGIPGGRLSPEHLGRVGELADKYGEGIIKITARQGIHIFRVDLENVKRVMGEIEKIGLKLAGGCGDAPRNITTCGLSGINPEELFDPWGTIDEYVKRFVGNRNYSNLPHKFKVSVSTCPHQCNLPEINDVALVGVIKEEEFGFTPLVGGSTALPPRLAKHMPVFLRPGREAMDFVEAYMNIWQENPKYRLSFGRARSKFLVEDCSMENIRKSIEARLGKRLDAYKCAPKLTMFYDHVGIGKQMKDGSCYIGVPLPSGILKSDQAIALANLAEKLGADLRTTVRGNIILVNIEQEYAEKVAEKAKKIGLPLNASKIRMKSSGCSGHPYCTYSLGLGISAREELEQVVQHLERSVGDVDISIISSDCPHACSRTWLGDIGLEGTSKMMPNGSRVQAFHILLGGGRGNGDISLARVVIRRALPEEIKVYLENLVKKYKERGGGLTFKEFCQQFSTEELRKMMRGGRSD
ncbi:MAG: nitrite/sulfite reductase [Candidatus Hadarchaeales archaeon]